MRLITRFENFAYELLSSFYSNLCDISNEFFSLGERIIESTLVKKIVRSLPNKVQPKVIAIEESKNLDIMKVEELIESLRTYELNLIQRKKFKFISLKPENENLNSVGEEDNNDQFAWLFNNFKNFLKKMETQSKSTKKSSSSSKGKNSSKPTDFFQ